MAELSEKQLERIFRKIHAGEIDIDNLPVELSRYTYDQLISFVQDGFGEINSDLKAARMVSYDQNIVAFSGAKTFQQVKDLNSFIFTPDGAKRPFKEYREFAKSINEEYNVRWLKTEQDTAFGMAQSADQWMEIEAEKDLFPMLRYDTVADGRVRADHAAWDGIVRPVNDSFWDTRMPINDFNCRCTVTRLTEGKKTNLDKHLKEYNEKNPSQKVSSLKNESELFNVNPGKVNYIFDEDKHPYFKHTRAEGPAFERSLEWNKD
jgi:hypothetical protein